MPDGWFDYLLPWDLILTFETANKNEALKAIVGSAFGGKAT